MKIIICILFILYLFRGGWISDIVPLPVTNKKYLNEVMFVNDTIASQLEEIVFKKKPKFAKKMENYKYVSIRRISSGGYFIKKGNNIYYVRDTIKPDLQQYTLGMSNYKYLGLNPVGYFV